jgi:AraC family ethanolamine operon transcriptional activator
MSIIKIEQKKITDFETMHDAVRDASFDIVQLERGEMTGMLTNLSGPVFRISTGSFSRGLRARGVQSESEWTLSVNAAPVVLQGFEVRPGDLFLLKPGQEIYASYPGANAFTVTLIKPDVLLPFVESQQQGAADAAIWQRTASMVSVDPKRAADRAKKFRALLEVVMQDGATMSADTVAYYRREILELVTAPVLDSLDRTPRLPMSAAKLVREVDRYLIENSHRLPHVSELREQFKVPARTLFHAFRNEHGVGPIAFMRHKRLCDVHTALKRGNGSVKEISVGHGFFEQGKFARDYRQLFGERPSETLRRARPMDPRPDRSQAQAGA